MNEFFSKISDYDFFDRLFPGFLFCLYACSLYNKDFILEDVSLYMSTVYIGVIYFVGLIISRLGSLAIETFAKKVHLVRYEAGFYRAEKTDSKIRILLKDLNMYRNLSAMFLVCFIVTLIRILLIREMNICELTVRLVSLGLLFFLFFFSYIKQSKMINLRILNSENILNEKDDSF